MKKTLRELCHEGKQAFLKGNWWNLALTDNGQVVLSRQMRVKSYLRRDKMIGGYRVIKMRRPAEMVVDHEMEE